MKRCTALNAVIGVAGGAVILSLVPVQAQAVDLRSTGSCTAVQPVAAEQLSGWFQFVASEMRALRAEILQLRLAAQESRIQNVERELQKVRQKQTDLQAEEGQYKQQIAETNALSEQPLDSDQRAQLESLRAELTGGGGDRIHTERTEAITAEARLLQQLEQEKFQQQQLQALSKQMTNPPTAQ